MGWRKVLGKVIGFVVLSWGPLNFKLALAYTVSDPPEAHVHGFGAFRFDCVVGYAFGCYFAVGTWSPSGVREGKGTVSFAVCSYMVDDGKRDSEKSGF